MRNLVSTILLLSILAAALPAAGCAQDVPVTPQSQPENKQEPPKPVPGSRPKLPPDKNKFAVIISGISGDESYSKLFVEWTSALHKIMIEQLGFAEERVTVLTEKPLGSEQRASAEVVRQTFIALRTTLKPENQLLIFFIGHGTFDGKVAKFNLIGPDLAASDYAQLIAGLPTRNIIIINTASASG